MSSVIEGLLEDIRVEGDNCDTLVAYFYFKHKYSDKQTHNNFMRAMVEQVMTRDPTLLDHLFDDLASIDGVNLRSTRKLESLFMTSLEHFRTCFIVVDGLDEALPGQADKSLKWLLPTASGRVPGTTTSIRLLLSGRRDGVLDHELSAQPSITLESISDHGVDIENYCAKIGTDIRSKFSISSEMERKIVSQVTFRACGKCQSCSTVSLAKLILAQGCFSMLEWYSTISSGKQGYLV